jgi:hypothetical protein
VSGVLASLLSFDPAVLERGMQQFLERLERLAPTLGGEQEQRGLAPWVVAAAAAAVACELARRQLRRPAEAPAQGPFFAGQS